MPSPKPCVGAVKRRGRRGLFRSCSGSRRDEVGDDADSEVRARLVSCGGCSRHVGHPSRRAHSAPPRCPYRSRRRGWLLRLASAGRLSMRSASARLLSRRAGAPTTRYPPCTEGRRRSIRSSTRCRRSQGAPACPHAFRAGPGTSRSSLRRHLRPWLLGRRAVHRLARRNPLDGRAGTRRESRQHAVYAAAFRVRMTAAVEPGDAYLNRVTDLRAGDSWHDRIRDLPGPVGEINPASGSRFSCWRMCSVQPRDARRALRSAKRRTPPRARPRASDHRGSQAARARGRL